MRYRARGQSLVEFALVLPIMIVVVMGIIDLSFFVFNYSQLENATRRASEFMSKAAVVSCKAEARTEAAQSVFFIGASPFDAANMAIDFSPSTPTVGETVSVKLTNFPATFLTPVGRQFFKNAKYNFTSNRIILSTAAPFNTTC